MSSNSLFLNKGEKDKRKKEKHQTINRFAMLKETAGGHLYQVPPPSTLEVIISLE